MADENKIPKMARPSLGEQQARKKKDKKNKIGGLGGLGKKKEDKVMMLNILEGRQHPDSMKLEQMKKITNEDGNIEFVELKAKGGRMGYKGGKSVKKKGGCAIKGRSKILR